MTLTFSKSLITTVTRRQNLKVLQSSLQTQDWVTEEHYTYIIILSGFGSIHVKSMKFFAIKEFMLSHEILCCNKLQILFIKRKCDQ